MTNLVRGQTLLRWSGADAKTTRKLIHATPYLLLALCLASMGCASHQATRTTKKNFNGAWSTEWCDTSNPQPECGKFDLYLVQDGERICGQHFVATPGLSKLDEGDPDSVHGSSSGRRATLVIESARDGSKYSVVAELTQTRMKWNLVEMIASGDNPGDNIIPSKTVLRPNKQEFATAHLFELRGKSCRWSDETSKLQTEPSSGHNDDISYFIPNDAFVRFARHGDIDHDGDSDALVILQTTNDAQDRLKPRTLLVLRRNASGELEKEVSNENAVLCQACGGMMGDPLQGISIDAAGFTLRFEGGSRELWSQEYRFSYSTKFHTWLLDSVKSSESDRLEDNSRSSRSTSRRHDSIPIDNFDSRRFPVTALP